MRGIASLMPMQCLLKRTRSQKNVSARTQALNFDVAADPKIMATEMEWRATSFSSPPTRSFDILFVGGHEKVRPVYYPLNVKVS